LYHIEAHLRSSDPQLLRYVIGESHNKPDAVDRVGLF